MAAVKAPLRLVYEHTPTFTDSERKENNVKKSAKRYSVCIGSEGSPYHLLWSYTFKDESHAYKTGPRARTFRENGVVVYEEGKLDNELEDLMAWITPDGTANWRQLCRIDTAGPTIIFTGGDARPHPLYEAFGHKWTEQTISKLSEEDADTARLLLACPGHLTVQTGEDRDHKPEKNEFDNIPLTLTNDKGRKCCFPDWEVPDKQDADFDRRKVLFAGRSSPADYSEVQKVVFKYQEQDLPLLRLEDQFPWFDAYFLHEDSRLDHLLPPFPLALMGDSEKEIMVQFDEKIIVALEACSCVHSSEYARFSRLVDPNDESKGVNASVTWYIKSASLARRLFQWTLFMTPKFREARELRAPGLEAEALARVNFDQSSFLNIFHDDPSLIESGFQRHDEYGEYATDDERPSEEEAEELEKIAMNSSSSDAAKAAAELLQLSVFPTAAPAAAAPVAVVPVAALESSEPSLKPKPELARITYEKAHKLHGLINHFEGGERVRTTYEKAHELHGVINHFEGGILAYITFEDGHEFQGEIRHFEDGEFHVRTTFDKGHKFHGEIHCFG